MDAYRTTDSRALGLKPGKYKFVSFTFDFPFTVNLDGKLEYAESLDQCVGGRGTQSLIVRVDGPIRMAASAQYYK